MTAVSIGLLEHVQNWRVEVEAGLGSDHALILWELMVQGQFQQVQRKLNWKAVNWTKFRQQLQAVPYLQGPWTFDTSDKVEEAVQQFTGIIQRVVQDQVPTRRLCQYSKNWWTPEIHELRLHMRRAARRWQRQPTLPNRALYLHLCRRLKSTIRRSKIV